MNTRRYRSISQNYAVIALTCIFFGIVILLFVHSLIIVQGHDWDLGAFLYLGSRLDNGELLYFRDFETKLPLLQYIFWVPYRLGGIGAWRSITFVTSLFLFVISTHFIVAALIEDRADLKKSSRKIVLLSSSVSLLFLYSLPGSSSAQISMFAAGFMYQAIALWHRALKSKFSENFYIILSGAATAIAVSIRPNYLFTIPALAMFSIVAAFASTTTHKYIYATKQLGLFIAALSFLTIIQFVPYFFYTKGPSTLFTALLAFRQFRHGLSFIELLRKQFFNQEVVAFYLFMYTSVGVMLFIALRRKDHSNSLHLISLSGVLTCILSIFALDYFFIVIHYFPHYSIMFVPYVAVIVTYLCILFFERKSVRVQVLAFILSIPLVGVCFSGDVLQKSYHLLMFRIEKTSLAINERGVHPALMELLKQAKDKGISFYVPYDVNYHSLLNEERIGDGHPRMLIRVLSGQRVGPVDDIFLYSERVHDSPCIALWESRKDLIVVENMDKPNLMSRCLTAPDSNRLRIRLISPAQRYSTNPYRHKLARCIALPEAPWWGFY